MSSPKVIVIGGGGLPGCWRRGAPAGMWGETVPAGAQRFGWCTGLRISGKGRGNIPNTADVAEFVQAFGPNGRFLYGTFSRFFCEDLLRLLRSKGWRQDRPRRAHLSCFATAPANVADALERWLRQAASRCANSRVKSLWIETRPVPGVNLYAGQVDCHAGSRSRRRLPYPKTGSTGDGYTWPEPVTR